MHISPEIAQLLDSMAFWIGVLVGILFCVIGAIFALAFCGGLRDQDCEEQPKPDSSTHAGRHQGPIHFLPPPRPTVWGTRTGADL